MNVKDYVKNNFSVEEAKLFDFVVSSFPESMLVHDEKEHILALLAILAKVFGNSRDLVFNLKKAHDIEALYKDAKNDSNNLKLNSRQLILPLAEDLKYHRIHGNLTADELIDKLIQEEPFIESYYQLYKNRGTLIAIEQTVKKFAEYLGQTSLNYDIFEVGGDIIILLQYLEDYIDFNETQVTISLPEGIWYSTKVYSSATDLTTVPAPELQQDAIKTVCTYDEINETWVCTDYVGAINLYASKVKTDSIIYDMLMKFKPAGIKYEILLKYATASIISLLSDRVIARSGTANTLFPVVEASQTMLEGETTEIVSVSYAAGSNAYTVTLKNNSKLIAYDAYVADWFASSAFNGNVSFESIKNSIGTTFSYSKQRIGPNSTIAISRNSTDPAYNSALSTFAAYFRNIDKLDYKSPTQIKLADIEITGLLDPSISYRVGRSPRGTGFAKVDITNLNLLNVNFSAQQKWYAQDDITESSIIRNMTNTGIIQAGTAYSMPQLTSNFNYVTKVRLIVTFTVGSYQSSKEILIENISPISPLSVSDIELT